MTHEPSRPRIQWYLASDPPNSGEWFLVTLSDHTVVQMMHLSGIGWCTAGGSRRVTAWSPLPLPAPWQEAES